MHNLAHFLAGDRLVVLCNQFVASKTVLGRHQRINRSVGKLCDDSFDWNIVM
jgi:hypothetical protein